MFNYYYYYLTLYSLTVYLYIHNMYIFLSPLMYINIFNFYYSTLYSLTSFPTASIILADIVFCCFPFSEFYFLIFDILCTHCFLSPRAPVARL